MASEQYRTVAVTGADGFLGRHLLALLLEARDGPERIAALDIRLGDETGDDRVEWTRCDLTDRASVEAALRTIRPEAIVHLAGLSGRAGMQALFDVNVRACEHLLSAASGLDENTRVLVVGSAAQYGLTTGGDEVVSESRRLMASTGYGASKIMQEKWAMAYSDTAALRVTCVRPFNIIGPGQPSDLVPAAFLHQCADVAAGLADEILVGNTSTYRDFTDVRDVSGAIWALLNAAGAEGEIFNIASGRSLRIADILDACIELCGTSVVVRQDPKRFKKFDVPSIVGDITKLQDITDWRPMISWRESLRETWDRMVGR